MNSRMRTELAPAEDLGLELALLCDTLDICPRGAFLFAVCEEGALRERLMQHVREHLEAEGDRSLIVVELSPDQPDLAGQLEQQVLYELPVREESPALATVALVHDRPRPPVVFVHTRGLAGAGMHVANLPEDHPERVRVEQIRRALRALNLQRERLNRLNVPLVFWLSQNEIGQVMQHSADVFAARSWLFYFETPVRAPTAPPPMRAEVTVSLLDRFHRTLLPPEELRKRAALYERRLERERAAEESNWPRIALLCRDLASIYGELDDYGRAGGFQGQAIEAYREAIAEREQEIGSRKQEAGSKEQEWASLQTWLGTAYLRLPTGDRAANLEQAIACLNNALTVWTDEAFPHYHEIAARNLERALAARGSFRERLRAAR